MNFEFSHQLPFERERIAETLLDRGFQESLGGLGFLSERTILSQQEKAGEVLRLTRCVLAIELPPAVRRFVGAGDPAWVEEAVWRPDTMTWLWFVRPEIGGNVLKAAGMMELLEGDGGTVRRMTGSVNVSVPVYGHRLERRIIESLRDAYTREANHLSDWLRPRV